MQGIQECNLHTMNLAYLVRIPGVKTKENYSIHIQPLLGLIYSVFLAFSLVHHWIDSGWTELFIPFKCEWSANRSA